MNRITHLLKEEKRISVRELKAALKLGSKEFDDLIKDAVNANLIEPAGFDYDEVGQQVPIAYKLKD